VKIIDRGAGRPLVVVPGIQGRWEYIRPAVDALAGSFRVITYSLAGERGSGRRFDRSAGMDGFADQLLELLDDRGLASPVICGVSFGGLVALRFAAAHPERTGGLILVSTPGPRWHLRRRHEIYARAPWLFGPLFLAEAPRRLRAEIRRAVPEARARLSFTRWQVGTLVCAPISLSAMAARARLIGSPRQLDDCARVAAPTLVVSGDPLLDHVVPVDGTSEYARLIAGARTATLDGTGHLGCITRPHDFVAVIRQFVETLPDGRRGAREPLARGTPSPTPRRETDAA
jgi:pimeloyl-ACP methyl ester carboxylesterase